MTQSVIVTQYYPSRYSDLWKSSIAMENIYRFFTSLELRHFTVPYLDVQESVVVLAPVAPHPVSAVTAWPVDVLAVRLVHLVQVRLHALLDPWETKVKLR